MKPYPTQLADVARRKLESIGTQESDEIRITIVIFTLMIVIFCKNSIARGKKKQNSGDPTRDYGHESMQHGQAPAWSAEIGTTIVSSARRHGFEKRF